MEKLNLKRNSLYEIEVNDKGETIVFDMEDIELPLKIEKCIEELEKISSETKAREQIISKKENKKGKYLLSSNEKEKALLIKEMYDRGRKAVDLFLGEGACQKVFGDRNYTTMFDDLFDALAPHFEKMKLKKHSIDEIITKKYSLNNDEELS